MPKMFAPIDHDKSIVDKEYVDKTFDRVYWAPVRLSAVNNWALSGSGAVPQMDGVVPAFGDRVVLAGQTDQTENGVYVLEGDATAWEFVRAPDANDIRHYREGKDVYIKEGSDRAMATLYLTSPTLTEDFGEVSSVITFGINASAGADIMATVAYITGDGTTTEFNITHTLGTDRVVVQLFQAVTGQQVVAEVTVAANVVFISMAEPPAIGLVYRAIIIAAQAKVAPGGQAVYDATATRSGTTFVLTVPDLPDTAPAAYGLRFIAPASYAIGDNCSINGTAHTIALVSGGEVPANTFVAGSTVVMEVNTSGAKCFLNGGIGTLRNVTATLTVAGWVGASSPYTQTLNITNVGLGVIGLASGATSDQYKAAEAARLWVSARTTTTITVTALGTKPTTGIPVEYVGQ